jgi:hypothetical protein
MISQNMDWASLGAIFHKTHLENIVLFYHVLCSHCFPANFLFSHKIVDISVLTWIGSAPPYPSGSAHLFSINAGVLFGVELVLI